MSTCEGLVLSEAATSARVDPLPPTDATFVASQRMGRLSIVLFALLMFVPYVCTIKFPPSPSFWAEWCALVLACAWLASLPHRASRNGTMRTVAVPVAILACGAYAAALLIQLLFQLPSFRGYAVLSLGGLVLAGLVCLAGSRIRAAGERTRLLDVLSLSFLFALALNALAVYGERHGVHLYIYQLGFRDIPARGEGLIGQPNQLAVFAALACSAATYRWLRGRQSSVMHLVIGAVAAFVIGSTGSRAGLIVLAIGSALGAQAMRGNDRRVTGWFLLATTLVFAAAAQIVFPLIEATGDTGSLAISRGRAIGRIELWRDSWELIKLHPLTGVGYGNFMSARWNELSGSLLEANANNAHNLVLNLAVELGVPLALCIVLPLGWAMWRCMKMGMQRVVSPDQFLVASIALGLGVYALLEYPLLYVFLLIPFALMLGLADQPEFKVQVTTLPKTIRWAGWAVVVVCCALVAVDYERLESMYTSLDLQIHTSSPGERARIDLQDAVSANALSLFDVYANLMYARTLRADGFWMDYKIPVNERAMSTMTNQETIGRQVAFLAVSGQREEALALLGRTRRSLNLEALTRKTLDLMAVDGDPRLKAFVASLPPMASTGPAH